jgi:hypothetical protein
LADRLQVENSAAMLIDSFKVTSHPLNVASGYEALTQLAPEFLKDFITRSGLAVNRYWREAVGRAGEPRSDRPTVPIVGPLYTESNARRLLSLLEYGLRDKAQIPEFILSVAPQTGFWGATTQQRDTLALLRRRIGLNQTADAADIKAVCLLAGKPARYVERTFDEVHSSDATAFSASLEMLLIPRVAVAAVVHAPIGAATGQAVALGFASFDEQVVARAQNLVADSLGRFIHDDLRYHRYLGVLNRAEIVGGPEL